MDTFAHLHWIDYVILTITILLSLGIGIFYALKGGHHSPPAEYFTGNHKLGLISTALSISVSYFSGIAMIGYPAEAYLYGGQFMWGAIFEIIGICLVAVFVVPVYPLYASWHLLHHYPSDISGWRNKPNVECH